MSRLAVTLTRSYFQVLSLRAKKAQLLLLLFTTTTTLFTTPLGYYTTRSASIIIIKTLKAYQRSQCLILYLSCQIRTVKETVAKTSQTLKGTYYQLSKSKRSCCQLLPLAPYSLLVTILSNCPFRLTKKITKVTLVIVGQISQDTALCFLNKTIVKSYSICNSNNKRQQYKQ